MPFVGRAGKLLEKLLEEIGLSRSEVFIANILKCLRYNALVQLGDGSWERIGSLVRSRYAGEVMSVDARGALVARKVTGWHTSPVAGRSVYRLTYRSSKKAGRGRVGIQLTGDHPVLTERGYVPVEELRDGDRIATGQGLSALARDVVCGTLLGDGCLQANSSTLTWSHSQLQGDYARFKARSRVGARRCGRRARGGSRCRRGPCLSGGPPAHACTSFATNHPARFLSPVQGGAPVARDAAQHADAGFLVHGRRLHANPRGRPAPLGRDRDERVLGCRPPGAHLRTSEPWAASKGFAAQALLRRSRDRAPERANRPLRTANDALQA